MCLAASVISLCFCPHSSAPPLDINAITMEMGYTHDWGVGLGLHSDWGGPVLDHFVAMLATLLLPIK